MEEEERYAEHVSVRLYVKKLAKPCVVIDAVAKRFSQSSLRRGFFFYKKETRILLYRDLRTFLIASLNIHIENGMGTRAISLTIEPK